MEFVNLVWSNKILLKYKVLTTNPSVFAIGAPFFYAKSLLSDVEVLAEKKRLGTNLLAFPMHSSHGVSAIYDPKIFLEVLKKQKHKFDTIRVCLYWKDILNGSHKIYLENGFECVCSGHIFDLNFLRRQKSLFQIADATISNGMGSHIGYSIFMNKPHCFMPDKVEFVNVDKNADGDELSKENMKSGYQEVQDAFVNNVDFLITEEQKSIIDDYWGISDMKTPCELHELFMNLYNVK